MGWSQQKYQTKRTPHFFLTNTRVFVLKELPEVIYTDLSEKIGDPRSYEDNQKRDFFNDKVNISIPCVVAPETPKKEEQIEEDDGTGKGKTQPNTEERKETS